MREETIEIECSCPGPLRVLVINATCNKKRFEYQAPLQIFKKIRDAKIKRKTKAETKIEMARSSVEHVEDLKSLMDLLNSTDFNLLLLFAHGEGGESPKKKNGRAATITIGNNKPMPWYIAKEYFCSMTNKVLVLCVCEGANVDSKFSTLKSYPDIGILVGARFKVTKEEAIFFLPRFIINLAEMMDDSINPRIVKRALNKSQRAIFEIFL